MPTDTASASVALRPMTDADLPFLYRLYASTRTEELAAVPWSDEQKAEFLRFQFDAQHRYYREQFPEATYDLVVQDDAAIGRLYVDRRDDELRLIDIALVPEQRGRGIGGALMRRVLDEARAAGKKVRIHVEHNNPAMRLYQRLGFQKIEDQGVYHLMEWSP